MDDWQLLQQHLKDPSGLSIDQIVRRHVTMVYSTALRELRDPHLAEDATQSVFLVLLQRASSLSPRIVLGGWLFQVTRYVSADIRKREARRLRREQEAAQMQDPSRHDEIESTAEEIMPLLNDEMAQLSASDRDTIILRFLQGKSHRELADALRISENAARQRLFRAVARLRARLRDRGINIEEGAFNAILLKAGAGEIPKALTQSVCSTMHAAPSTIHLALAKGAIEMMVRSKQILVASVAAAVILAGGVAVVVRHGASSATTALPSMRPNEAATPATSAAEPSAQAQASARQFVAEAYLAATSGDEQTLLAAFDSPPPALQQSLRQMAQVMSAGRDLQEAIETKFGATAASQFVSPFTLGMSNEDINRAEVTISGSKAVVDLGSIGPGKIPLVRANQSWKIDPNMDMPNAEQLAKLQAAIPLINQLTADVNSGKYASVLELQRAMAAMMKQ
jgi:RNA polymerase sigma factor (sigma-70 family)